jgi:hypothetical protein
MGKHRTQRCLRIAKVLRLDYDKLVWARAWRKTRRRFREWLQAEALLSIATAVVTAFITDGTIWQRFLAGFVVLLASIAVWLFILMLFNLGTTPSDIYARQTRAVRILRRRIKDLSRQLSAYTARPTSQLSSNSEAALSELERLVGIGDPERRILGFLFDDRQFGQTRETFDYFDQDPVDAPAAYSSLAEIRTVVQMTESDFSVAVHKLRGLGMCLDCQLVTNRAMKTICLSPRGRAFVQESRG